MTHQEDGTLYGVLKRGIYYTYAFVESKMQSVGSRGVSSHFTGANMWISLAKGGYSLLINAFSHQIKVIPWNQIKNHMLGIIFSYFGSLELEPVITFK